jgi:hypothetical protein
VTLLYHLVGRSFGPVASLLAALALTLIPVSVATNCYNKIRIIYILWIIVLSC